MVCADLYPRGMRTFCLFRAMGGVLGSKGFPEQFDHLCCTQFSRDSTRGDVSIHHIPTVGLPFI
jgi:hypothetical protein